MPNKLAHFAIEAQDVLRAKAFYETVFGWTVEPWGPPDFYQITGAGVHGALQIRSEPVGSGRKGFPLTFAVTDLAASTKLIEAAGGAILSEPFKIPTVGELVAFADTEANEAIIMQYEPAQLASLNL